MKTKNRQINLAMKPEELQQYLQFKRRGFKVKAKKGKGSYDRNNFKKRDDWKLPSSLLFFFILKILSDN